MSKMIITADWHIKHKNRIWVHNKDIINDLVIAIEQIKKIIVDTNANMILLAGDIFDSNTTSSYGLDLILNFINHCKKNNVKIKYIQGQHDMADPPLLTTIDEYCEFVHNKVFYFDDIPIVGLDYSSQVIAPEVKGKILVTHQTWREFLPMVGNYNLELEWLPKIIISGDYHANMIVKNNNRMLISPGSIIPQGIDELGDKYVMLFNARSFSQIKLTTRIFKVIEIKDKEAYQKVYEDISDNIYVDNTLPEEIRKPVLIIKYNPEDINIDRLLEFENVKILPRPYSISNIIKDTESQRDLSVEEAIKNITKDESVVKAALSVIKHGVEALERIYETGELA